MSEPDLIIALRDLLGSRLVAYLCKVHQTRMVRQWADGSRCIGDPDDVDRLWMAYRIARLITERESPAVAQAWFQGANPSLNDRAPAQLLRDASLTDIGPQILAAAHQFTAIPPDQDTLMTPHLHRQPNQTPPL